MDRLLPTPLANLTTGSGTVGRNVCESNLLWNKVNVFVTTPSWESVNQELKWFFSLHIYGFACLFFILSFYTFFSFLNLRSIVSSPPLMSTINMFLCMLGFSRSACLFADPYGFREVVPKVVGTVAWDIGFIFITSAFCLIQLAFLQLTQVKFGLERFYKKVTLIMTIGTHFALVLGTDVGAVFHILSYMLAYSIQLTFLLWALSLYATFMWAGYKVKLLLNRLPSNVLLSSEANQKGIMQLAMLAPYNNLATSVAAALVPTLLGPAKLRALDESTAAGSAPKGPDTNPPTSHPPPPPLTITSSLSSTQRTSSLKSENGRRASAAAILSDDSFDHPSSTVPEVYVRPPTPTPSIANLPIITVSSPSRRSSLASRRGSDVSRNSRRASECSVRFVNDEDTIPEVNPEVQIDQSEGSQQQPGSPSQRSPPCTGLTDRQPEGILRRNSDCGATPTGSNKDLRRSSDFAQEKTRSQFATKLRRNSDFGNRVPRRSPEPESAGLKLSRILDVSPVGSRRNSDLGGLVPTKAVESRRNSDFSGRSSERWSSDIPAFIRAQPGINRRASDASVRSSRNGVENDKLSDIKSESDSDQPDYSAANEKAALMNGKQEEVVTKTRKKNLSWKNDKVKDDQEDITAETSLLPEVQQTTAATAAGGVTSADFTLHSILNHIAYVNRTKSGTPLHIPEASTAAARRAQIKRVLNMTYATAILGILLCLADAARILGPYGIFAESIKYDAKPLVSQYPKAWPWIIFQTVCRFLELAMGCAMASITKQPSASPRHQYLSNYQPPYHLRMQKKRDNLYI